MSSTDTSANTDDNTGAAPAPNFGEAVVQATKRVKADKAAQSLAALPENLDELKLPVWFFGFEAVFACAYDLIKAFPMAWPALLVLVAVNITLSLTVLRKRLRMAKALWRNKETRKVAIGLLALRIGSHFVLGAVGVQVTTTAAHLAFAVVMGGVTVGMLAFTQRTALRALAAARAASGATPATVAAGTPAEAPATA
jgi:hypothetical protein